MSFLCEKDFLEKSGAGAYVIYSLAQNYRILEELDIKEYFKEPYLKREVKESFKKL